MCASVPAISLPTAVSAAPMPAPRTFWSRMPTDLTASICYFLSALDWMSFALTEKSSYTARKAIRLDNTSPGNWGSSDECSNVIRVIVEIVNANLPLKDALSSKPDLRIFNRDWRDPSWHSRLELLDVATKVRLLNAFEWWLHQPTQSRCCTSLEFSSFLQPLPWVRRLPLHRITKVTLEGGEVIENIPQTRLLQRMPNLTELQVVGDQVHLKANAIVLGPLITLLPRLLGLTLKSDRSNSTYPKHSLTLPDAGLPPTLTSVLIHSFCIESFPSSLIERMNRSAGTPRGTFSVRLTKNAYGEEASKQVDALVKTNRLQRSSPYDPDFLQSPDPMRWASPAKKAD